MSKKLKAFKMVSFDWPVPPEDRRKIEEFMRSLGYDVDGGSSELATGYSYIYIRPKARIHRRRASAFVVAPEVAS